MLLNKNKIPVAFSIIQLLCFVLYYIFDTPLVHPHAMISIETFFFLIINTFLILLFSIFFLIKKKHKISIWIIPFFLFIFNLYQTT